MRKVNYPGWIDEYARSVHNTFMHLIPGSWGPLNAFEFAVIMNGSIIEKLAQAIKKIKTKNITIEEVARIFPNPSSLRCAIFYLIDGCHRRETKNWVEFKEVIEYLVKVLSAMMKEDLFCLSKNIIHSPSGLKKLMKNKAVAQTQIGDAREIGKLYNSLFSLTFALYRDFFPQISQDIYGPYDYSQEHGSNTILIIKHFSDLRPTQLWPKLKAYKFMDVKIYQFYKDVKFRCELIGMHPIYEGDIMSGLIGYIVEVDGKRLKNIQAVKELSDYVSQIVVGQSRVYEKITFKEIKLKFLEWTLYQYKDFFELAGMNWRPSPKMKKLIENRKISKKLLIDSFPNYQEFSTSPNHEIFWLKELYGK